MPRHRDALVSFDVPRDWIDRTAVAYAAPEGSGTANLVMTRDALGDDEELEDYALRQIEALAERLRGFVLESLGESELAGRPARIARFRANGPDGPLVQRLTLLALPERKVVAFTMTAPARDVGQLDPLFDRIASSIRVEAES